MKFKWWFIPVALGGLFVLARLSGVLQFYHVPTASNEPTIKVGSLFFATNLTKPKRLDFVCYHQAAGDGWPDGIWVKRLCGLPGDKIEIINSVLFVNGQNLDSGLHLKKAYIIPAKEQVKLGADYINDHPDDIHGISVDSVWAQLETQMVRDFSIAGHLEIDTSTAGIEKLFGRRWTRDNFGPVRVPEDHFFVLGDNRDASVDTRYAGFMDRKDYIGKVFWIIK